jgi:enterochelin esterase-like enzyme
MPTTNRTVAGLFALATLVLGVAPASAQSHRSVDSINARLHGTLVDFTRNDHCDRRIYSSALCECRDLYVYLPPGYDPKGQYPLLIWLHSYTDDECEFAKRVAPVIDAAVASGALPPMVVAAPDGSLCGNYHWFALGSWYVNSRRGRFADFIMDDVLPFMDANFAVCHDRSGRAIAGFSMGGFGAFSLGMKHSDKFKVIGGISPAVNLRYSGASDDYMADFDSATAHLRDDYRSHEIVGEYYGGLMKIRAWMVVQPVFGRGTSAADGVAADNPLELLDRLNIQPGQQDYYIGYGLSDEMNIDAQVGSFLHATTERGIHVEAKSYPCGDHSIAFMLSALPDFFAWLKAHLNCRLADSAKVSVHSPLIPAISTAFSHPIQATNDAVLVLPRL